MSGKAGIDHRRSSSGRHDRMDADPATGPSVYQHRVGTTPEITCRRRIAGAAKNETAGRVILKRYDELRGEGASRWAELRSRTRPFAMGAVKPFSDRGVSETLDKPKAE